MRIRVRGALTDSKDPTNSNICSNYVFRSPVVRVIGVIRVIRVIIKVVIVFRLLGLFGLLLLRGKLALARSRTASSTELCPCRQRLLSC